MMTNEDRSPIELTMSNVRDALAWAVNEKGGSYVYVNPSGQTAPWCTCSYAYRNGEGEWLPSCIVGHVFHHLGIDLETVHNIGSMVEDVLWVLTGRGLVAYAKDVETYLNIAQRAQDTGAPWDAAYAAAEAFYQSLL
jgi:hypothetical protein